MKVKLNFKEVVCANGVERVVLMFPDGHWLPLSDPIHYLLMHLEILGLDLDKGFTIDDGRRSRRRSKHD